MHFQLSQVLCVAFIINSALLANVIADHDDCFKYDLKNEKGFTPREKYHECGATDAKTASNTEVIKCLAGNFEILNEDGSINQEKQITVIKQYTYPEYLDKTLKLAEKCNSQPAQKCFSILVEELRFVFLS